MCELDFIAYDLVELGTSCAVMSEHLLFVDHECGEARQVFVFPRIYMSLKLYNITINPL